ncbi:hypothetical protein BT69DRAFT_224708 [Atractiella rhizophila]|nr:hypothetical protein BT69DRAFT_224708 [Atractiella rhizophila]
MLPIFAALALPLLAKANVFITNPVGASEIAAGKSFEIEWQNDSDKPALKDIGDVEFQIWTGSQSKQTQLESLGTTAATKQSLKVTIPKDIGPSGEFYFIRAVVSDDRTKDIFSSRFTVTGATGQFSADIIADLGTLAGTLATAQTTSSASKTSSTGSARTTSSSSSTSKPAGLTGTARSRSPLLSLPSSEW